MREPRIKEILDIYNTEKLAGVYKYLTQSDMYVYPNSWAGNIKKLIEDKNYITASNIIELLSYKITKNYGKNQIKPE